MEGNLQPKFREWKANDVISSAEFRLRKSGGTVPGMAVISMDAFDHGGRSTPRRRSFQRRNAVASFRVENEKRPTEFGYRLLRLMSDAGLKPAGLARAADVSGSTITRLVYGGSKKPDSNTLASIARALVEAGEVRHVPAEDVELLVESMHNELLHAAGYRLGAAPPPVALHPKALLLQQAIGEGSPLDDGEIRFLDEMVGRLLDPFEKRLRKRSA